MLISGKTNGGRLGRLDCCGFFSLISLGSRLREQSITYRSIASIVLARLRFSRYKCAARGRRRANKGPLFGVTFPGTVR